MPGTDRSLGFGIIGCGWVAPAHAAALALTPGAHLAAVADLDLGAAAALASRFGAPRVFADYRELLRRPEVDVVTICLPQHLHASVSAAAHAAGKHVLCEKPLAMTVAECDAMIAAARAAGRALGVVFNYRYAPAARLARSLLASGAIGRPRAVTARISMTVSADFPPPRLWRESLATTSGGVLVHRVIHLLDFLVLLFGVPEQARALLASERADELEDAAAVAFAFPAQVLGTLLATTGAKNVGTRIEILGTDGALEIEDERVLLNGARQPAPADVDVPHELTDALLFGTGHVWAVREFVAALRAGAPVPVDGEDGRRVQHVLEQVYRDRRERAKAA